MPCTRTLSTPKIAEKLLNPRVFYIGASITRSLKGRKNCTRGVITDIAGIWAEGFSLFSQVAERKIHKTNIYSRKRGPVTQGLPAITWCPPSDEQSPTNKVQKWLNKYSENST